MRINTRIAVDELQELERLKHMNRELAGIILELKQEIIMLRSSRDLWKKGYDAIYDTLPEKIRAELTLFK